MLSVKCFFNFLYYHLHPPLYRPDEFLSGQAPKGDFPLNSTNRFYLLKELINMQKEDLKKVLTLKVHKRNIPNPDRISSTFPVVEKWSKRLVSFQAVH